MINYLPTSSTKIEFDTDVPIQGYAPRYVPKRKKTEVSVTEEPVTEEVPVTEEPVAAKSEKYKDRNKFVKDLRDAYTKELTSRGLSTAYVDMLVAQDALESA